MANFEWVEVDNTEIINLSCVKAILKEGVNKLKFSCEDGGYLLKTFNTETERDSALSSLKSRLRYCYFSHNQSYVSE